MKISAVKKLFVGPPLATAQARHERLSKSSGARGVLLGRAVLGRVRDRGDPARRWSSPARAALACSIPIGVAIAVLLAIVVISYRQTILAYPSGGGAYIVAKDNLGTLPGAGGGGGAADRLRAHGGGERRGGRRRAHLRVPGAATASASSCASRPSSRSRSATCAASASRAASSRCRPTSSSSASRACSAYGFVRWRCGDARPGPPPGRRRRGDGQALDARSCCSAPSPTAARRMTGVEAVSTACPPSSRRRRKNAAHDADRHGRLILRHACSWASRCWRTPTTSCPPRARRWSRSSRAAIFGGRGCSTTASRRRPC